MSDAPDTGRPPPRLLVKIMGVMAKMAPPDPSGENPKAVRAFRRVDAVLDVLKAGPLRRRLHTPLGQRAWPVVGGEYRVGNPAAAVAVCTLSSKDLVILAAALPGVAIAGRLHTVNLGIERMIVNVTANPAIRALVLCGKDSPMFHTAQGIRALINDGVDGARRIVNAEGHLPVLSNVSAEAIARFRRQVALVDATGVTDLGQIAKHVADAAARVAGAAPLDPSFAAGPIAAPAFKRIESGGHREPIAYDPNGFFIVSVDRTAGDIVCRHYQADNTPAHEVRARSAERIVLALLRENLVSQMSHAAYLGGELAKAEAALQLGLIYEQDKRLGRG